MIPVIIAFINNFKNKYKYNLVKNNFNKNSRKIDF